MRRPLDWLTQTRLAVACAALLALMLAHTADHSLRHDTSATEALAAVGLAGIAGAALLLALAVAAKPIAAPGALVLGLGTALGFVAVHVAPAWSAAFSYPYPELGLDALSWAILLAAIAAAIWVAVEGARARSQGAPAGAEPTPAGRGRTAP